MSAAVSSLEVEPELRRKLHELDSAMDTIDVRIPWLALPELHTLRQQLRTVRLLVPSALTPLRVSLVKPELADSIAALSVENRIANMMLEGLHSIRALWHEVDSRLATMFSEALAWLSVWLGLISLALAVLPWLWPLLPNLVDPT